jgi:hypothetical protein
MPKLWFIYSTVNGLDAHEPRNSPYSITWNLGRFLRAAVGECGYGFEYRNLDDLTPADVGKDDIIIGHPWHPNGIMNEILLSGAGRTRMIMQPYQHDIVGVSESGWYKELAARADHLLFVTGQYWWDTMEQGLYGEWKPKATRIDMAVNPALHPYSKKRWNPPGKRGILAIGQDVHYKGLDLIAGLAQVGGFRLGYYGNAPLERFQHVPQFTHYGGRDFNPEVVGRIAQDYDAFISLARGDANPTTLLETACWGLIGFCNKESGYWPDQPFLELRLDDMLFNLGQMDWLQAAPEKALRERSEVMREHVVKRHTWQRFCATVWQEVHQWLK